MAEKKEVRVHVTSNGGVYVDADELMRSDASRKIIEQAKRISEAMTAGNRDSAREESDKAT